MLCHVITRSLVLAICMHMCIARIIPADVPSSDWFTRGTVYFPISDKRSGGSNWGEDYLTRGTIFFPPEYRQRYKKSVAIEPGMMDHMCVMKPNFYCMCTSNGYVSFCENFTSSYFGKK